MPSAALAVITGKTIRNAVKTGVLSEPRKRKAISITDITGVAEISEKRGWKKAPALLSRPAAIPQPRPRGTEITIAAMTLRKVLPREEINLSSLKSLSNSRITGAGPGKIRPEAKTLEDNSQKKIRNIAPAKYQNAGEWNMGSRE
jgi:hypothetical protein